jgi:hypothetical protein
MNYADQRANSDSRIMRSFYFLVVGHTISKAGPISDECELPQLRVL